MNAVLKRVLVSKDEAVISPRIQGIIEEHVDGLVGVPTASLVAEICKTLSQPSEKADVLYYFMVESPLRAQDLTGMCRSVGLDTVRQMSNRAAQLRDRRLHTDRKPRWTA